MKKIAVMDLMVLCAIATAQDIKKVCKTCNKLISNCPYKGKHPQPNKTASSKPSSADMRRPTKVQKEFKREIFEFNGFLYHTCQNGTAMLRGWSGTKPFGEIIIPSSVEYNGKSLTVSGIWSGAFKNCTEIVSVKLPNTLVVIDQCAFDGCSQLKSITIPNDVQKLGVFAFSD